MNLPLASEFPAASEADWQAAAEQALKGRELSRLVTRSLDGIEMAPIYNGTVAATRAFRASGAQGAAAWDVVQRIDIPDIAAANAQALEDLGGGASGLALVLPGAVSAEAGGVPVASEADLARVLRDVELDLVALRLDGGRLARSVAPWLLRLYRQRNLDLSRCALNLGLDPVSAFAQSGYLAPRETLAERMSEMLRLCDEAGHGGPVFVADGRIYHEAGAAPAQSIGMIAATLVETLRLFKAAGHDPSQTASRLAIVCSGEADQFMTMCQVRALRLVWQRICQVLGIAVPAIRIEVETSLRMMSRDDAHVNMLRATSATFGAGTGGADAITVLPFSAAIGVADGIARRMARNIQHILLEESGLARVADPAAGSGYVEHLTGDLARRGWAFFQAIEGQGGAIEALISGFVQPAIADTANQARKMVAERRIKLTGVSEFANPERPSVTVADIALPSGWDATAQGMVPPRNQTNELTCERLVTRRLPEDYERLRDAAEQYAAQNDQVPHCIFLVKLGAPAQHTARATWIENLLTAGGSSASGYEAGASLDGLGEAYAASGCPQACICGSDDDYASLAPAAARALKKAGAGYVWLAGKPGENQGTLQAAGIDGYMYDGANIVGILQSIHALSGVDKT